MRARSLERQGKPLSAAAVSATAKPTAFQANSFDPFDVIKGHLLDEGYADTEDAALAIMSNMSEEWKQSIIENRGMAYSGGKPGDSGDGGKPKGITGGKTYKMPGFDGDSTKKPKLKGV
jgi:hypothetical protein